MNIPIDLMVHIITVSTECQSYLQTKYPHEYQVWTKYYYESGAECPFARAAIKRIFGFERQERGQEFLGALGSQTWGSAAYQGGSGEQSDRYSRD